MRTGEPEASLHQSVQIIRDPAQIQSLFVDLAGRAKTSLALLMPSTNAFVREQRIGVVAEIFEASSRGVKIRILSPLNTSLEVGLASLNADLAVRGAAISYRSLPEASTPNTVTVLIVDDLESLVIEQKKNASLDFAEAVGAATYSNSKSTVLSNVRFFDSLWEEVGILNKESRSRKVSELWQDILSHDIKNYNQIVSMNAEILGEEIPNNSRKLMEAASLIEGVVKAGGEAANIKRLELAKTEIDENLKFLAEAANLTQIIRKTVDGSSGLVERTKRISRIVSLEENHDMHGVDIDKSIKRAISLVANAHPEKKIEFDSEIPKGALTLADELLDEVFVNLFSNAVRYTQGPRVPILVRVRDMEHVQDGASVSISGKGYWKVEVIDEGRGIPKETKQKVFSRYMDSASGTGLGLSIVHMLVINRYLGQVRMADRVEGDYSKGTRVEMELLKA
jgi:two-component system, OmpR family, sensor histidine kinase VicK